MMQEKAWLTFFLILIVLSINPVKCSKFSIEEATIKDIQLAFAQNKLTSTQLVDYYIHRIQTLNPLLRAVLELNPHAQRQADQADRERSKFLDDNNNHGRIRSSFSILGDMHGIPVLLKDSIATKDEMNTSAGSYALVGSLVPRDAAVVDKLRRDGAIILGKASMSEWYHVRSFDIPDGWCARAGQGMSPYVEGGNPCGSSSGSAISVATNMVTVSLGTETDGSILCPADRNSVVGLKPTVGLTSRGGVIPVSPRQDSVGPICRTVSDAVYVLDSIVGFDPRDYEATKEAAKFIPVGGYKQFLNEDGLKGKRLGVLIDPFLALQNRSIVALVFKGHLKTMRRLGATIVDKLDITNLDVIMDPYQSGEAVAMLAEFKSSINGYLKDLISSPVRSLADIITFNLKNPDLEKSKEYGQELFVAAELTNGMGEEEREAIQMMEKLSRDGFEKYMKENELDALVTPGWAASTVLAIGGYPGITVPAGFDGDSMPFGICFGGLKGSEPTLIEIAYAFEQATMSRKSPDLSIALHSNYQALF